MRLPADLVPKDSALSYEAFSARVSDHLHAISQALTATAAPPEFWIPSRVEALIFLWNAGLNGEQCGRLLGCSRSAIVGKVSRMRRTGARLRGRDGERDDTPRYDERTRRRRRATPPPKPKASAAATAGVRASVDVELSAAALAAKPISSIMDLERHHCRFIDGDPVAAHVYCGRTVVPGTSWCEPHLARVFETPKPQRRRGAPEVAEAAEAIDAPEAISPEAVGTMEPERV